MAAIEVSTAAKMMTQAPSTHNALYHITNIAIIHGFASQPVRVYQQQRVQASGLPKNEMGGVQTLAPMPLQA